MPDHAEFLARHQEIAAPLAECLAGLEFVREAAPQLMHPAAGRAPGGGGQTEFWPAEKLGDYRIVREIGRGGMGIVYEVLQVSLGRRVALKILPFGAALDAKQLQRFRNEAQAAAQLHHQHIVPVYGVGCERGVHYYAMQYIDGQTLAALIAGLRSVSGLERSAPPSASFAAASLAVDVVSGRWAPPARKPDLRGASHSPENAVAAPVSAAQVRAESGRTADSASTVQVSERRTLKPISGCSAKTEAYFRTVANLLMQAASALEHAHASGIVHRDVKPANLLLDARGNLWITDFGLAHCQNQAGLTMTGELMGTLRYMSPEQALGQRTTLDHRTDVYSLGATLYELLTLEPVFAGRDRQELLRHIADDEPRRPRGVNKAIPVELETIALKALEKSAADRYASAQQMADDLRRYLHDEPVHAQPPTIVQTARKWIRRHRAVVYTAAAMLSVLVVALAIISSLAAWRLNGEQKRTEEEKERVKAAQQLAERRAEQICDDLERLKTANRLIERSRAYLAGSRWDDAQAALIKAVELRPDHAPAWGELADLHTRLGLWDIAATDFARELELRETDTTWRWYFHALVSLYVGDTDGYRRVSRQMWNHFRGTLNTQYVFDLVRTSALSTDSSADRQQCVGLARHAVTHTSWGDWGAAYALGLAQFRAGQHEEAVRRLEQSLPADQGEWNFRTLGYAPLAMAQYRLGRADEARKSLDAAARALDHWTERMYRSPEETEWVHHLGATGHWEVAWWDWLEAHIYYREAKLLIDGFPPPDDPRIHVLRARALAGLRWPSRAEVEYAEVFQQLPGDPQIALEVHRNRGYMYVGRRQWEKAAREFDQASELKPNDSALRRFAAISHLTSGDVAAYRRRCAGLLERFERTDDRNAVSDALMTCALRPDALPEMPHAERH